MIPGDLLSAFPYRQFHTLPGHLDSWAALPNSNPNACVPMQGGNLYHFYDGLLYDPAERRTHDRVIPKREDLSRSLEINAIWTFDTEFPTIFNKSCTYITFKSAVKHRQLGYGYPRGQTVHLAEATTQDTYSSI